MKSTTSFRASDEAKKQLSALHSSVSAGAERAIDCYLALRSRSLHEIKGKFSRGELSYLVDMMNGTMLEVQFAVNPSVQIAAIEDADKYEGLAAKWGVNLPVMIDKFMELNSAQCLFLIEEIKMFWENPQDLDGFLDKYSK
jgi:hypothetical protein